ncbi:interaptin isoform X3 [Bactrocera oleae]|uniref:interaptin isoform X3 n=1 Tax=Bactrocera oleae TaxID=104688 RepID=UPI00387E4954
MESNTESKEKNVESNNVVEDVSTEVEIEDCSDNSQKVVVELPTQNEIQTTKAETKLVGKKKQDETERIEVVDENNTEGYDHSLSSNDLLETVIVPEKVVEDDRETTNTSPKTTFTAPVVTEQQNVTECKSKDKNEIETLNKKIEGQGDIGCAVEGDKPVLDEDNIVENKEVKLSENAETAIALLSVKPQNSQDQVDTLQPGNQLKAENWNNTIKDIISDIDLNIEQENCDLLKQQQKELLQRQQELVEQIQQQQLIAQQLAAENQLHQQQLQQREKLKSATQQETQKITSTPNQKPTPTPSLLQENISKYSTVEEKKDEFGYTQNTETYEYKESTNAPKHIDLLKIFTPAADADEIVPRNHSSLKEQTYQEEFKENNSSPNNATQPPTQKSSLNQVPLRFLMNPFGKVRDITSVSDSFNIETGLLSPNKCAELVTALQTQKGKGAELFAKRRRKSEKWVVDDTNTGIESPSGLPDYHQQQSQLRPATSPSILPAYSDAGKHRVQLNLHQEQVLEKYVKPGLKVVKTPWEAALETGSASTAFIDDVQRTQHVKTPTLTPVPVTDYKYRDPNIADAVAYKNGFIADYSITPFHEQAQIYFPTVTQNFGHNPQRALAYKPSLAKGWKAPSPSLPKERGQKVIDPNECTYKITYPQLVSYEVEVVTESKKTKSLEFLDKFMRSPSPIRDINLDLEDVGIKRQLQQLHNEQKVIESDKINSKSEYVNVNERLERLNNYNSKLMEKKKKDTKRLEKEVQNGQKKDRLEKQRQLNRSPSLEHQHFKKKQNQENEYVKIAVRELISNYEQQLVREEDRVYNEAKQIKSNQVNIHKIHENDALEIALSSSLFRENRKVDDILSVFETHQLQNQTEELYLPKEISLESYAPSPVVTIKGPENFKSSRSFASTTLPRISSFPLTKPNTDGFRSYGEPNGSRPVQQETSQIVSQINYNPSPLPYDKIAKFQNVGDQAQNNDYNPQIRRLSMKSYVDEIQNIPPTSFGEKSASVEQLTISPYHSKFPKTDINYIRTPSPVYTKRINPTALLHGQNYNNTARGWKSSGICSYKSPCDNSFKASNIRSCGIYQQMPLTAQSSLPYTDF